jgi:hypothetical protein
LWRVGQFDQLELEPLSQGETTRLLSATLGAPVEPRAAARLWKLTLGNILYLRNIVEQEVADGRFAQQDIWRWSGDPVVPRGLGELVEQRITALPPAVCDVVDALAVGEPLALEVLTRITDPAAVEDADTRGLITVEPVAGSMEVRVAHPLYGEVRRNRAAPTRLRRVRGLVATELAKMPNANSVRALVRRATLTLDSDLDLDPDLLVRAAEGAVWLIEMPLAKRLAEAAARAGGGADASFVCAVALSSLGGGQEADAVLAEGLAQDLTDSDRARLAFLRAYNRLVNFADPEGAKRVIDEALDSTSPESRGCIDAFLTLYWAAMANPAAARAASIRCCPTLPRVPPRGPSPWPLEMLAGSPRQSRARNPRITAPSSSTTPMSERCCWPATSRMRKMSRTVWRGNGSIYLALPTPLPRWRAGPHSARAAWMTPVCC